MKCAGWFTISHPMEWACAWTGQGHDQISRERIETTMALAGPYQSVRVCANHKLSNESQVTVNEV